MRGKHLCRTPACGQFRITPADAGKTSPPPTEKTASRGSPPRMRGKLDRFNIRGVHRRITPADAGKTKQNGKLHTGTRDHPRGCGENCFAKARLTGAYGSPPRMRGKLENRISYTLHLRITPADAGKTLKRSFRNQPFCS